MGRLPPEVRARWWTSGTVPTVATILAVVLGFALVLLNKSGAAGHPARYGQVQIPGSATVTLPAGSVDLTLESDVDEGFGLNVPAGLAVAVTAVTPGAPAPTVTHAVGGDYSRSPGATQRVNGVPNTYQRLWKVDVPRSGEYRVVTSPPGLANPHGFVLDIGHSPGLGDLQIWERVGVAWLVVMAFWYSGRLVDRRRRSRATPAHAASVGEAALTVDGPAAARPLPEFENRVRPVPDHVERLTQLAKLHEAGELTDAEFAEEKHRVLNEG